MYLCNPLAHACARAITHAPHISALHMANVFQTPDRHHHHSLIIHPLQQPLKCMLKHFLPARPGLQKPLVQTLLSSNLWWTCTLCSKSSKMELAYSGMGEGLCRMRARNTSQIQGMRPRGTSAVAVLFFSSFLFLSILSLKQRLKLYIPEGGSRGLTLGVGNASLP